MNLAGVYFQGVMTKPAKVFGWLVVAMTYTIDVYLNFTTATLIFLELPPKIRLNKQGTITYRLGVYLATGKGWRSTFTKDFMAPMFLDPFDYRGKHVFPVFDEEYFSKGAKLKGGHKPKKQYKYGYL